MIRSYINIAFRNLSRYKSFAIINIIGLAIGLAASLIIALWVFDELSYDKFHENSNNIYRVERHIHWDGEIMDVPVTGAIYAETIKKDIPEVLDYTRIDPTELSVINYKNSGQEEQFLFVDKGFFNVFSFPLLRGNPETALAEPYCVVMTRKAALAYFGEEFPIDKSLEVEWGDEKKMFRVTGILDDIPSQNHFQFEILGSFITFEEHDPEHLDTWVSNYLYSYVLLHPETDPESLDPKLRNIVEEHIAPAYEAFLGGTGEEMDIHEIFQIRLRPLESIHLNSDLLWEIEPQGNITTVYIFSVISFLILLMACFNFMNLSTALGSKRSREIGIRKTAGATRGQLISQLLSESIVIAILSLIIALIIVELSIPGFNTFTGKELSLATFLVPKYMLVLILIVIGTGVLAGLYPAFYLSKFNPMVVLHKNIEERGSRFSFRQVLVVFQFSISILLIIGTITAYLQINYFYDRPVGYDFFETYEMGFLAGRPYSRDFGTDTANKFIVNEQVIKKIGIMNPEEAIGVKYGHFDMQGGFNEGEIIGVLKDFHFKPMDKAIEPITFMLNEDWMEYITIRYETKNVSTLIEEIDDAWKAQFPNEEYIYFFLQDRYESLYIEESRMKNILLAFTLLAIFIGCLGLFGLAASSDPLDAIKYE